ncbi:PREDICTED: serpin B3-like [Trachymyrmex cornetzi]|uniref:Serpin B3 n=1 Tax=Trachymyrmex cornetzi TaxID=471704 RepID=A0A151IZC6_9HYME|nr:PREDICTED: serpin B3-like [Trachymyrmex cornetzi]KYN14445.1 Serpin B3 [Trachymyrmex cornetzi]
MLADARFKFALDCLKKCITMGPKNNFFFSPHLLYHNLLLAYFGAIYDLESTLRQILHIPDSITKYTVEEYYTNGGDDYFFYIANGSENSYTCRIYYKIIIDESKGLYVDSLNLHATANSVKECNFSDRPNLVRNFVNNIVSCTTQSYIQNLLPPNSIDENTEIIMFNTIYFKGRFDKNCDTAVDTQNEKNTLIAKHIIYKSEQLDLFITEVPCKEKKMSTFFLYPSQKELDENNSIEVQKLNKLLEQLTTEEGSRELRKLLDDGIQELEGMVFPITIKDVKIEHDLPIYKLLEMLGIPDFTPISGTAKLYDYGFDSVQLGDIVHRVSVNLTSNDIMATASNVMFTYNACKHARKIPETVNIIFPCICLVYDRTRHNILFCGMLRES